MPAGSTFRYRPGLDGVRALAVAMVMLYHGGVSWAGGGFLGVDVFFVLSGFLITSLLLGEIAATGRIDVVRFWRRRARRLLPALFLLVLGVALYAAFLARPTEVSKLRSDGVASLFYLSNWKFIFDGTSYFQAFQSPSPLAHTWSLAIEEQWYLLWPLALLGLWRCCRGRLKPLIAIIGGLAAGSAFLAAVQFHAGRDPSRVYYGSDTRAQALLVGALLAALTAGASPVLAVRTARARKFTALLGCCGAGVIGYLAVHADARRPFLYRGGFLLVAVAAAAFVMSATVEGPISRMLSVAPLRAIGLISYGLYLTHWPVDVVVNRARTGLDGYALFALQTLITFAIATTSYVVIERPIRRDGLAALRLPAGITKARVLVPAAAASVAGFLFVTTTGAVAEPTVAALVRSHNTKVVRPGAPRVLLLGDSQLLTLGYFSGPALVPGSPLQYKWDPIVGCGVFDPPMQNSLTCASRALLWMHDVASFDPDLSVLMLGAWETLDFTIAGHRYIHGTPEHERALVDVVTAAIRPLTLRGGRVALLEVPCYGHPESTDIAGQDQRTQPASVANVNQALSEVARADRTHVSVVRWADVLCPGGRFVSTINGIEVRLDGVHFVDKAGAKIVTDRLAPALVSLATAAHANRPRVELPVGTPLVAGAARDP